MSQEGAIKADLDIMIMILLKLQIDSKFVSDRLAFAQNYVQVRVQRDPRGCTRFKQFLSLRHRWETLVVLLAMLQVRLHFVFSQPVDS